MAMIALLKVATGSEIKGAHIARAGAGGGEARTGHVPVLAAEHRVESQIDPVSGQRLDDRTFHPFVITKLIDHSSPAFHQALAKGEVFKEWTLDFKAIGTGGGDGSGEPQTYLRVVLGGARVVSIRSVMPDLTVPANVNVHEYEEIAFQYDGMGWGESGQSKPTIIDVECNPAEDWAEAQARATLKALPEMFKTEFDALKETLKQAGHELADAVVEDATENKA